MKAKTLTMLAGVGLLAGTASADFVGLDWAVVDNGGWADATYDVYAMFTSGDDFLSAVAGTPIPGEELNYQVTGGTFYQNAFGSTFTAPNGALFGTFPSLEFDTFVSIGAWQLPDVTQTVGDLAWSADGTQLTAVNGSYFITPDDAQGTPFEFVPCDYLFLIARLSVLYVDVA